MSILLEMADVAAAEALLVSIPESLGLLVFGITLVVMAVLIRWALGRAETVKSDDNVTKKA